MKQRCIPVRNSMYQVLLCVCCVVASACDAEDLHPVEDHHRSGATFARDSLFSLSSAIRLSIEASPSIRAGQSSIAAEEGLLAQAGYWSNPELRIQTENVAGSGRYGGARSAEYTIGVDQRIELGGKRAVRRAMASEALEISRCDLDITRLDLIRDVHVAYVEVLGSAEELKVAAEQETLAKGILETVSDRVAAGAEPSIQRNKAQLAFANAAIVREVAERNLQKVEEALAQLWGDTRLPGSPEHAYFFEVHEPDAVESFHKSLEVSPDLRRQRALIALANRRLDQQRTHRVPDITVGTAFRYFNDTNDRAFVFDLSLPLPLFDRNQGNIESARAEVARAEQLEDQWVRQQQRLLSMHWRSWQSAYRESLKQRDELVPAAVRSFESAREGFDRGKFAYIEVLDAQRSLVEAWSKYYEALKSYHISRADVLRIAGAVADQYKGEKP